MPVDFGPPTVVRPSHELLGETLLGFGRASEARAELERQLARTPGRAATLLALARAASAAGDSTRAAAAYDALAANVQRAEPDALIRTALPAGRRTGGP